MKEKKYYENVEINPKEYSEWKRLIRGLCRGRLRRRVMVLYIIFHLSIGYIVNSCYAITVFAAEAKNIHDKTEKIGPLYAQAAVLMDGSSGRILYEKNGKEFLANASTTKILTCILALENADLTDVVQVSSYAASMPDVQLHIKEGEQYYLGDLLYSLMLESHNDVAVAIAEHIAGSQENFSRMMNRKAKEIGCKNTRFLTPNGLDAVQKVKSPDSRQEKEGDIKEKTELSHGTTASDLALMMRYCIKESPKKDVFLEITATPSYSFENVEKTRSFTCRNHNAFLNMMEGVMSGKTGFTGKAGYCYVGALERDGRCYIVALLACGWPGNKHYKWADCKKLMEYGLKEYELFLLKALETEYKEELTVEVKEAKRQELGKEKTTELKRQEGEIKEVLLNKEEEIEVKVYKQEREAPLDKSEVMGRLEYYINREKWLSEDLVCNEKIEKIDFLWCFEKILRKIVEY